MNSLFRRRTAPSPGRLAGAALVASLASLAGPAGAADAPNSPRPIHVHRLGEGRVDAMKEGITVLVESCRMVKGLPDGAPILFPPDGVLAKLALYEIDEYFDGEQWASYQTVRTVAPDPRSATCELKLVHQRTAWVGRVCSGGTKGRTRSAGELFDFRHPLPPKVDIEADPGPHGSCDGHVHAYDLDGLPREDAGEGRQCVWNSALLGKTLGKLGMPPKGRAAERSDVDFCVYVGQPIYVFNGHRQPVILKGRGDAKRDAIDAAASARTGYVNQRVVEFSDGTPIPEARFSESSLRAFLDQPAITAVGTAP
ncbi:hypothetical protein [Ideonella sp.]|uniref:hypothetical protein n=1 Tax=Ideonella sp. TaxID=1929293 RepID=UPI0035AF3489